MKCFLATVVLLVGASMLRAEEDPASAFKRVIEYAEEEEAYAMGVEAYLYGYPRVELARRIHNEMKRVVKIKSSTHHRIVFTISITSAVPATGWWLKRPTTTPCTVRPIWI